MPLGHGYAWPMVFAFLTIISLYVNIIVAVAPLPPSVEADSPQQ